MYEITSDTRLVRLARSFLVKSKGVDRDEFLRNWLFEPLYYFYGKRFFTREI